MISFAKFELFYLLFLLYFICFQDEEVEGVAISAGIEERSTTGRMQVY